MPRRGSQTLMVLGTVLILLGCAPMPGATTSQPPNAAAPTTISRSQGTARRVLHILGSALTYPGEDTAMREIIAAFEQTCDCSVEARFEGQWTEVPQRLQAARIAHEPVDIITTGANLVNSTLARGAALMDLTELVTPFQRRFRPGMLAPYTIGGHLWAIPYSQVSTSAIFYNLDMFKELGLEAPQTYQELVRVSGVIRKQKQIIPMIHQGKASWMWPMWFFETYAQTSGNHSVALVQAFLRGDRKFTNPEEVAAFAAIGKFTSDGVLGNESLDTDHDGMIATFAQQKAAMFYGGTWEVANIRAAVKTFQVGVFEFPRLVDDPNTVPQHGGGPDSALAISSMVSRENLDLAVRFLEFVTRKESANKLLGVQSPFFASVQGVRPTDDPLTGDLVARFYPHTIRFLDWIWPVEVNDAVRDGIAAVVAGALTPEQAAQGVQEAYDRLVQEKAYRFDWPSTWSAADWAKVRPPNIPNIPIGT
jgi:raffinose/stachyose/melibiose transport system substrate-binding protein